MSIWVSLVLTCPLHKVTHLRGTCPRLRARNVWYFKTNSTQKHALRETCSRRPTGREGDYEEITTPLSCPPLFLPSAPSLNLKVTSKTVWHWSLAQTSNDSAPLSWSIPVSVRFDGFVNIWVIVIIAELMWRSSFCLVSDWGFAVKTKQREN